MTASIIIALCILLLVAYLFDLTSASTKIPSVILLLITGLLVKKSLEWLNIPMPNLSPVLPVLGTVGLILIVMEGSLELELNKSKIAVIRKSFLGSLITLFLTAFFTAWIFYKYDSSASFTYCLINAVPVCIISSAIAIPSVHSLPLPQKEFVIYESSLSDILGVLLFNFLTLNDNFGAASFGHFGLELLIIIVVSFIATAGLAFLLSKINHHVKFVPIILLVILIYAVSKIYHLPGLIFILLFGLFLGNLDELKRFKWIRMLKPEILNVEVRKFRDLTGEAAFLIRSLFFLLFGFFIEIQELADTDSLAWAAGIVTFIFALRALQLKLSGLPLMPLLFIAPRGLITILLFLSISAGQAIPLVSRTLIIQIIVLSALVMMAGLMLNKQKGDTAALKKNADA